jgi:hypothetical protein
MRAEPLLTFMNINAGDKSGVVKVRLQYPALSLSFRASSSFFVPVLPAFAPSFDPTVLPLI